MASFFVEKWRSSRALLLPILVTLVVMAEILFFDRLDMEGSAAVAKQWTSSFYFPAKSSSSSSSSNSNSNSNSFSEGVLLDGEERCIKWLEDADRVAYTRDFHKDPVLVAGGVQDWSTCSMDCKFGGISNKKPDAQFGLHQEPGTANVLRSMESSHYYFENNVEQARRRGYDIVMTTSLSSDVPVGYFSWAEYDIMAPVQPKTEEALAAAFISNCGARNFRLQALQKLESLNVKIDSYGSCHRNRDGRVDKVETLKRYKFSLAFENSNEEDYVTEKFLQSLVAGTIPVVIGAPNIQDFAPLPGSVLHIKQLDDADSVAKAMKYLASNPDAYNKSIRWKYDGPSDSFKALVDMAAVHSSCRLCIHLATKIQEKEEAESKFKNRPCKCSGPFGMHHLYVRERGRFQMESIFLRSSDLTINGLESAVLKKFKSLSHEPIWKNERPESIRGNDYKVYRIYPVGMTQKQALYTFHFNSDDDLKRYVESTPCAKLEVTLSEIFPSKFNVRESVGSTVKVVINRCSEMVKAICNRSKKVRPFFILHA